MMAALLPAAQTVTTTGTYSQTAYDCLGMPKDIPTDRVGQLPAGSTTPSEEMYLITVAMAEEAGWEGPLPLASLAESLSISPVSANQMVRRLAERGLMDYHPYRGVLLSARGRAAACRVLRGRRLWTRFLVGQLGFGDEEADALACDLEHLTPPRMADRLEAFLRGQTAAPAGDRSPRAMPAGGRPGAASPVSIPAEAIATVPEPPGGGAPGSSPGGERVGPGHRPGEGRADAGSASVVARGSGRFLALPDRSGDDPPMPPEGWS
jgi:DtxR family Mn-dependent transcriptional regulator